MTASVASNTRLTAPPASAAAGDTDAPARVAAIIGRLNAAAPTNIGFPAAVDIDYRPLAPLLGHLLNNVGPRTDPINPGHVNDLEREVLALFADLFRAPPGWSGYITSGGTEDNLHALWLARTKYPNAVTYHSTAAHPVDRTNPQLSRVVKQAKRSVPVPSTQCPDLRGCVVLVLEDRELASLVLPSWGRVVHSVGLVPFVVVDPAGLVVEPIECFLRDFVARGSRPGSVRSYACALVRWWRFLRAVEVGWERATPAEGRDFVLWMRQARKGSGARRARSTFAPGSVNPVTGKQRLDDAFKIATVGHSNAVVHTFFGFWIEQGAGPLLNPMPRDAVRGRRPHEHHNPMEPFRAQGRLRYNPRLPRRRVRAMPDAAWDAVFTALRSDRDRAIAGLAVSTAARASELLGIRLMTWTGAISSSGSIAREWVLSSGCQAARRRSCGCACILSSSVRLARTTLSG
jgi:hypothetical protein